MADQVLVQEWQPFFMALAGATAALAGLVFIAMSLHPRPILIHPLMRVRAFGAAFGFLIGLVWALTMLLPARTSPLNSLLLIAVGVGGSAIVIYREVTIRSTDLNLARVILGDVLAASPIVAGLVGLVAPTSEFPFVVLVLASCVGIFLLFFRSWTLVLHSVTNADAPSGPEPRSATVLTAQKVDE